LLALSLVLALLLGGGTYDTSHHHPGMAATTRSTQDPAPVARSAAPADREPSPAEDAEDAETPEDAEPTLDPGTEVRLAVVGDIMLARKVGDRIQSEGTGAVLAGVR